MQAVAQGRIVGMKLARCLAVLKLDGILGQAGKHPAKVGRLVRDDLQRKASHEYSSCIRHIEAWHSRGRDQPLQRNKTVYFDSVLRR